MDAEAQPADGGRPGGTLDLHRLAATEASLVDVEHALARLDVGTWGTCEHCAAPLDHAVLAERPAARACPDHA